MALTLLAANNAQTVLAAGISASATSMTVNSGTGALFPAPSAGVSFFKLTLIDAATGQLTEIVHVTARSGDTMTIDRAQEGTTARAWSANDIAANMMTAGTLSYLLTNFQPLDATLTAISALTGAANKLAYFNGTDTAALTDLTSVGRDIIGKSTIADVVSYLGVGTGRLLNIQTFTSGSGTYTPTAGMKYALVYVLGSGGGSGSSPATTSAQTSASPGGASGSWAFVKLMAADIGTSQTYIVGVGGAAGISGAGGDGSASSLGTLISCPGGKGSTVGVVVSTSASGLFPGGSPGGMPTISAGTVIESSNGNPGGKSTFITSNTLAGDGASSPKGSGGQGLGGTSLASPGTGQGSGAGGASCAVSSAAKNGASGANGGIWIWEYA
ncbi:hypothetical protein BBB57_01335 [Kosakonia sacchari]|uniref:glycine-rich domain-containing protein n=1 Tax=Kosakonia sacchari TaxID=1158459 RepID=UPI00080732B0|nr:hypothetical protein [Kosakonia sacchari]ANR77016.1 hypothetical protein BBB57_01335 [Kosakonia sacchari]